MHVVFDDRCPEFSLYESGDGLECIVWATDNYPKDHESFPHIWIERR